MHAKGLTPILNVSDIGQSFAWFEKLGWKKLWDWGDPPGFGAVGSGECEIFLCQGAKEAAATAASNRPSARAAARRPTRASGCRSGWTTSTPSTGTAWSRASTSPSPRPTCPGASGMHLRHPDGHVFRISQGIKEAE